MTAPTAPGAEENRIKEQQAVRLTASRLGRSQFRLLLASLAKC